ncbi:hypothetical protein [Hungatella sp.]|uniref:hypothetical protein n=1 Tax=Hungatella sp. TaxID=2613924 RepID=UPI00399F3628
MPSDASSRLWLEELEGCHDYEQCQRKVKQLMNLAKAKARKETGLFVAEGLRMFKEIPRDRIDSLFVSESFLKNPEGRKLIGPLAFEAVADDVFKTMSDTTTPQGVLALVKQYAYTIDDILDRPGPALLMILDTIQDGNWEPSACGKAQALQGDYERHHRGYLTKVIHSTMGSSAVYPFFIPLLYPDSQQT